MLPVVNLIALLAGATGGMASNAVAARAAKAEQTKADKEFANQKTLKQMDIDAAQAKAVAVKKAEIEAKSLADIAEKDAEVKRNRTIYENFMGAATGGMDVQSAASKFGFEGLKEKHTPMLLPVFDKNGEIQTDYVETGLPGLGGQIKPRFELVQIPDSSQTGPEGAVTEFQAMVRAIDSNRMNWNRTNKRELYDSNKNRLSQLVFAMAPKTPAIAGVTASVRIVPQGVVDTLTKRYGPRYAFEVVSDALASQSSQKEVEAMYTDTWGLPLTNNAQIEVVQTPAGLAARPADHQSLMDNVDDVENGQVNMEASMALLPAAKLAGYGTVDDFKGWVNTEYSVNRGIEEGAIVNDILDMRSQFMKLPLYKDPYSGGTQIFMPWTTGGKWTKMSDIMVKHGLLIPQPNEKNIGNRYSDDLLLIKAMAPEFTGIPPLYGPAPTLVSEGARPLAATQKSDSWYYEDIDTRLQYIEKKWGGYIASKDGLGGRRDKALAQGEAIIVLNSLIHLTGEQTEIPVLVGIGASAIKFTNNTRKQIGEMLEAVSYLGLSAETEETVRNKLVAAQEALNGSNIDASTKMQDIANAIGVREYYEGVLIYTMAMALQGGNAAARTISDADIERITQILNLAGGASKEQRVQIFTMLRNEMMQKKAINDQMIGGGEAGIWAAIVAEKYLEDPRVTEANMSLTLLNKARAIVGQGPVDDQGRGVQSPNPVDPGNLGPGYELNEDGIPVYTGKGAVS